MSLSSPEGSLTPLLNASDRATSVLTVEEDKNALNIINGCYVPCLLNILGVILFLRLGWAVGQAGVCNVFIIFGMAESMTLLTVLSLSAMLTNGAMRGGGSYFMISRALGPEFGGSVGLLFWIAYAVGASFYIVGFAEEICDTWVVAQEDNEWFVAGIGSISLFVVLLISLGGARYFTKVNVILFIVLFGAIVMVLLAIFVRKDAELDKGKFLGWSWDTVKRNWGEDFTEDKKTCGGLCNFKIVFSLVFPAATGIMEGANLSGDLADPNYSIPRGTLMAVATSIVIYLTLVVGFAGCADRTALQTNFIITQEIAWSENFVVIGILVSTGSSALGAIFGGSRILQALARDEIFPGIKWLGYGTKKGDEPIYGVLLTWAIAQVCTLMGSLDKIAPIISSFFCLSYAAVNLACFLLEVSGTPNFRPDWKYYSKWLSMLGFILAMAIDFLLDWVFALVSLLILCLIFFYLVKRGPDVIWGDVSQSVIFHQVRKYLLRLDKRKQHNKLWRPSILLLLDKLDVRLVDFCNTLKKGGLFVIGNVIITKNFQKSAAEGMRNQRAWRQFINKTGVKAFPKTTVASTVRLGYQNLIMTAGLGAMVPNTIVLPLINTPLMNLNPSLKAELKDFLEERLERRKNSILSEASISSIFGERLDLKIGGSTNIKEFLSIVRDILSTHRNILVTENFEAFDSDLLNSLSIQDYVHSNTIGIRGPINGLSSRRHRLEKQSCVEMKRIDVWIDCSTYDWNLKMSQRDSGFPALMMQLAFIVSRNPNFSRNSRLRGILLIRSMDQQEAAEKSFLDCCRTLRLRLDSVLCVKFGSELASTRWIDNATFIEKKSNLGIDNIKGGGVFGSPTPLSNVLNELLLIHSGQTCMIFFPLPEIPPTEPKSLEEKMARSWLSHVLHVIRSLRCPIVFVQTGEIPPVISTSI